MGIPANPYVGTASIPCQTSIDEYNGTASIRMSDVYKSRRALLLGIVSHPRFINSECPFSLGGFPFFLINCFLPKLLSSIVSATDR